MFSLVAATFLESRSRVRVAPVVSLTVHCATSGVVFTALAVSVGAAKLTAPVTAVRGALMFGEPFGAQTALGPAIGLTAVVIVHRGDAARTDLQKPAAARGRRRTCQRRAAAAPLRGAGMAAEQRPHPYGEEER